MTEILKQFGPQYPALGNAVAKFRRQATHAGSILAMDKAQLQAYGQAVENAIIQLQRQELRREVSLPSPRCASGTWHNDAESIETAIRGKQKSEFAAACARDRKRDPHVWVAMYEAAMAEKRQAAQ